MKTIPVHPVFMPLMAYASQGNAILGIKGSGKSYGATYIAEQLIEAGVPIIAFDPIGIWRNLKVPGRGRGYPVVVAHPDTGDLPLTPQSAPQIVRAAMRENVSLVIDLYSIKLSKRDWRDIVERCIEVLLFEEHPLRHVFIEEAAEFVPQRVQPEQGKVYARMESLARMGGNRALGYTLINQRSEEVNKAVLEICDCLILHRQKGRNSLTALGKWLDFANPDVSKEVIQSLPTLAPGDCWIWPPGTDIPTRCHFPLKNSFHPDRQQAQKSVGKKAVDVGQFVERLQADLVEVIAEAKENDPDELRVRIGELEAKLAEPQVQNVKIVEKSVFTDQNVSILLEIVHDLHLAAEKQDDLKKTIERGIDIMQKSILIAQTTTSIPSAPVFDKNKHGGSWLEPIRRQAKQTPDRNGSLGRCERAILTALAQHPAGRSRPQLAVLTGYSLRSSGFSNALSNLRTEEYITRDMEPRITESGRITLGPFEPLPKGEALRNYWLSKLGKCERGILGALMEHRRGLDATELSEATGYSTLSSGFNNSLSKLRTLELITRGWPAKPSENLFQ